jgi:type II secretory pathway component GspD/PulD (secretin)
MQDLDIIEAAIQVLDYVPPQINIKCKVVEVSQDDIQALGLDWLFGNVSANNAVPTSTNRLGIANAARVILTDPQFRMVLKVLQQRNGAKLLAEPEVTTLSSRQAQMKMKKTQRVVTGINERALTPPGITATNGDESPLYVTEPREFGQTVDVVACLLADGYTIDLTVIPTAIEFLGYVKNPTNRVAVYINGNRKSVTLDQPQVRRRQTIAIVQVWDGQTVVLRVPPAEKMTKIDDRLPMVAKSPPVGPAFRIEPETTNKQTLLIFITPTLIDPTGNLIHSPEEMPFSRNGTPPQPAR